MHHSSSLNGPNGRDSAGRFAKGNPGGPGNPHARRSNQIRAAFFEAVTNEDVAAITRTLIDKARGGDVLAAREVFDRLFGKPNQPMEVQSNVQRDVAAVFQGMGREQLIDIIRAGGQALPPILEEASKREQKQIPTHAMTPDAAQGEGN